MSSRERERRPRDEGASRKSTGNDSGRTYQPRRTPNPKRFVKLPQPLIVDSRLPAKDKIVYAALLLYGDGRQRKCDPSMERIAFDIGTTREAVHRAIQRLRSAGWIEVEPRPGFTSLYFLHVMPVSHPTDTSTHPEGVTPTSQGVVTPTKATANESSTSLRVMEASHELEVKAFQRTSNGAPHPSSTPKTENPSAMGVTQSRETEECSDDLRALEKSSEQQAKIESRHEYHVLHDRIVEGCRFCRSTTEDVPGTSRHVPGTGLAHSRRRGA